jgi:exopolyphosphatase/guanosine-5'-triphosphate,3'-diphosphate pyrophosphatase
VSEEVRAGIDVGTNAVKCIVARVADGRIAETLHEDRRATRLGEGLGRAGRLGADAVRRTAEAVCIMTDAARSLGAARIRAVSTSAARDAANPEDLIDAVRTRCGITVEVLPGDEEARLSFLAICEEAGDAPVAMFDLGGGSTEWVLGRAQHVEFRRSVDVGAVRLTERSLSGDPPTAAAVEAARAEIKKALDELPDVSGRCLIGTGGTVRNLAAVYASHAHIPWEAACRLTRAEVERQIAEYASLPAAFRQRIPGLEPDRVDIILAGALVVAACMDRAAAGDLTVTERGLRHGLVLE